MGENTLSQFLTSINNEPNDTRWNKRKIQAIVGQKKRLNEKAQRLEKEILITQLTENELETQCDKKQWDVSAGVTSKIMHVSLASFTKLPDYEAASCMYSASTESTENLTDVDGVRHDSFVKNLYQLIIHLQSCMRTTFRKKRTECMSRWMERAYPNAIIEAVKEIVDAKEEGNWEVCLQKANRSVQLIKQFPDNILPDKMELLICIYSYFCPMFVETGDFSKAMPYQDEDWICAVEKLVNTLPDDKYPYEAALLYFEMSVRYMTSPKSSERRTFFKGRSLTAGRKTKDPELQIYCNCVFALVEWKTSVMDVGPAKEKDYFRRLAFSMERSLQLAEYTDDKVATKVVRTILQEVEIRCKRPYVEEIDRWIQTRFSKGIQYPWIRSKYGLNGLSMHQSKVSSAIKQMDDIYVQQCLENQEWEEEELFYYLNYSLALFHSERNQILVKTFLPWICKECVKMHQPYKVSVWAASISKETGVKEIPVLVCNYWENVDKKFRDNYFFGLLVIYQEYNTVNEEEIFVQSSTIFLESTLTPIDAMQANEIISANTDWLMRNYSNLEVIRPCSVRSKCLVVKKETCIVLYCRMKGYIPLGEKPFPKTLYAGEKSLPVDVREGFYIPAMFQENSDIINAETACDADTFCMGLSLGPSDRDISATVGPFVQLEGSNVGFLTCAHVFGVPCNIRDALETHVVQPARESNGNSICGYVENIVFDIDPNSPVNVDAALIRLKPEKVPQRGRFAKMDNDSRKAAGLTADQSLSFDHGEILAKEQVNEILSETGKIIKFGAASGVTSSNMLDPGRAVIRFGEAELLHAHSDEFLPIIGGTRSYVMKGQYIVRSSPSNAFLKTGDSGAGVFFMDDLKKLRCIGIATGFFSNTFEAVVTPIEDVLRALELDESALMRFNVQ